MNTPKRAELALAVVFAVLVVVGMTLGILAYRDCRDGGLTVLYCLTSIFG